MKNDAKPNFAPGWLMIALCLLLLHGIVFRTVKQ